VDPGTDERPESLRRLRGVGSDLGGRASRRSRASLRDRAERLRQRAFVIGQAAIAAAIAYAIAGTVLGHPAPFFAPVAAIVALGVTYGQRLRRVVEVTVGVAVGVGVGDLFVSLAGTGPWQVAVVVATAMAIAVLLDAGTLIVIQAAVQATIVTTLLPDPAAGLGRWLDAVVGGLVALAVATVAPVAPLRRPRILAGLVIGELAVLLREAARSAVDGDAERASRTLSRARRTEPALRSLREAAAEGLEVVRTSPLRRRHRDDVQAVADLAEPLDRAVRNARVLARRVAVAVSAGEPVPRSYIRLVGRLADVVERMATELDQRRLPHALRADLEQLAADAARVEVSGNISAVVVLAQIRSMIVDLLPLTGAEDAGGVDPHA
jgi:uncharacterized membrane protein YgaE (UPF0421/DUF939 family)